MRARTGVGLLMSKQCAIECAQSVLLSRSADLATEALVFAMLALGCYIMNIQSGTRHAIDGSVLASQYFQHALARSRHLAACDATFRIMQASPFSGRQSIQRPAPSSTKLEAGTFSHGGPSSMHWRGREATDSIACRPSLPI